MAGEWTQVPFSKLCDITRGASPRPIHDWFVDVGIPWVKISDANSAQSRYITETGQCIKPEGRMKSVEVRPGDLILSNSATPGIPKFMGIDACIHDGWLLLRNLRNLDKQFAYYLLLHERPKLVAQGNGSVFTNLKTEILKNHLVQLPPISEQRAIAHILGTLDDKIELNRRRNQTLEAMARALFKDWFVDFGPVRAKMEGREPYLPADLWQLFPDRLDDEGKPEGWGKVAAETVADIGIGKTPPRKEHQWFSESNTDVRWASIRDMGDSGVFLQDTSEYLTREAVEQFNVRVVPDNTVILSFKLTVGRVAITDGEIVTNEAIAHFKIGEQSRLSTEYMYSYLREFEYGRLGSTSSIATAVNSKSIKALPVLVPTNDLADRFTGRVALIFARIKHLQSETETLAKLRDNLLPKLICGKLRIADAEKFMESAAS